jgi:signal peptidase I
MFKWLKITGNSLNPDYQDGDYVVISQLPLWLRGIRPGDVIVFRHAAHGTLIKHVASVSADGTEIFVLGAQAESIDSRQFGAIRRPSVMGKVLWHIKKPVK